MHEYNLQILPSKHYSFVFKKKRTSLFVLLCVLQRLCLLLKINTVQTQLRIYSSPVMSHKHLEVGVNITLQNDHIFMINTPICVHYGILNRNFQPLNSASALRVPSKVMRSYSLIHESRPTLNTVMHYNCLSANIWQLRRVKTSINYWKRTTLLTLASHENIFNIAAG